MQRLENDKIYVDKVIICSKTRRGRGDSSISPVRTITEVFELDGTKIAEYDIYSRTLEEFEQFLKDNIDNEEILKELLKKLSRFF